MKAFDSMARKAHALGRVSKDFALAAEHDAGAAGLLASCACLLWWIGGWKWAVLPALAALWAVTNWATATLVKARLEKLEDSLGPVTKLADRRPKLSPLPTKKAA
ncbi:MAG TPA: hypothetical protein VIL28_06770 [Steroidobacteraceae bacterium]